jgi:hypothetical protein
MSQNALDYFSEIPLKDKDGFISNGLCKLNLI